MFCRIIELIGRFRLRVGLPALLLITMAGHAAAQAPETFFSGKTINIVVGFEAGGGYDAYARLLARHMSRHAGGANIVVQNRPGAGSLVAANYLFNVAPKDGTAFGIISSGVLFDPLFGNKAANFEATEFSWLGSVNREVSTCQIWHTAPVKTFEDARATSISVGGTGAGADSHLFPQTLNSVLGTKFKIVSGYPGATSVFLAMERGELEGICGIYWSTLKAQRADWLQQGILRPLVQLALEKHPEYPDVPLVLDFARTPEERGALELVFAPMALARPFLGPPGVPADRLAFLRRAFEATMKDAEFLAEAERLKLEVSPMYADEVVALLKRLYQTPPNIVERAKAARS
jgi:tripartite-type tricarboxylate transporter receptor subunit TctC